MNYRNVSNFAKGLITNGYGRGKAPLDSLLIAENIRIHTGTAEPRKGQLYLDDDAEVAETINALYQFTREKFAENEVGFWTAYLFSAGQYLYTWENDGDVPILSNIDVEDDVDDVDWPLTSDDVWIAFYMDWAYITNGVQSMKKYDAIDYFEVGIDAPPDPVVTVSDELVQLVDFRGFRAYRYRYVRMIGFGTNISEYVASPMSNPVMMENPTNNKAIKIELAASDDYQVTHIELYSTDLKNDHEELFGAEWRRLDYDDDLLSESGYNYQGLDNVDRTFTDKLSNIQENNVQTLSGYRLHPIMPTTDWTNPPDGLAYLIIYKDRMYGVELPYNPSALRYSRIGEPEAWPQDNWIEVRRDDGDVITALGVLGNSIYIFKNRSIWSLTGDPDSVPILQVTAGGDRTGTQTEFGLGCTASRSLAAYGEDTLVFYNKVYGVYMIQGGSIVNLSQNVGSDIIGLDDASAGTIYQDENGDVFYVLSPPSGDAWVCHLATKTWVKDTNVNVPCFCVNSDGQLLGGITGLINRYYHPDQDTDNGTSFLCKLKQAWLNLRNGEFDAVVRKIAVRTEDLRDNCTLTLYSENGEQFTTTFTGTTRRVGIDGISGRLFSALFTWTSGKIESLTYMFIRRRGH